MTRSEASLFEELLGQAKQALDGVAESPDGDPQYYADRIDTSRELGSPRREIDSYFKKGQAIDATYASLYVAMARCLQARWGGSSAEFPTFAQEAARAGGEGMYARVAYLGAAMEGRRFKSTYPSFEWPRLRLALEGLLEKYPASGLFWNLLAWFGCHYGDGATAKRAMDKLQPPNDKTSFDIWSWKTKNFTQCKDWAQSGAKPDELPPLGRAVTPTAPVQPRMGVQ